MGLIRTLYHNLIPQTMPPSAAEYYEKLIDGVSDFYLRPFCEKILNKYPGKARILDIGTGTGQLPVMLTQRNKEYQITAIDLSEKCLEIARSKAAVAGVSSQIKFLCMDMLRDDWDAPAFDLIISTCSLHHWKHPVQMLKKAKQLLSANSEIWILDDLGEISALARAEWIAKVEKACKPGWLFKSVFTFQSKFLAYSRSEIEEICKKKQVCPLEIFRLETFFCRYHGI